MAKSPNLPGFYLNPRCKARVEIKVPDGYYSDLTLRTKSIYIQCERLNHTDIELPHIVIIGNQEYEFPWGGHLT
jgi:hypothetical protein